MIIVPYASSDVLVQAEDAGVKLEFYPIAAEALVFITPKEYKSYKNEHSFVYKCIVVSFVAYL
ncbi:MAG TPA: hypothetical protein GX519_06125 [Thermoanaerobacterales bacterium]|nr:hypothetical protein [Thermoanaerobacterales bacterium]